MKILRWSAFICNAVSITYWALNAHFAAQGTALAHHMTMPFRIIGVLMMISVTGFTSTLSLVVLLLLPRSIERAPRL
jgi:hypothetical protein